MPIYEYQCASCHHCFDLIQKIDDKPETICPECSKNTAVRLISAAGFQLKGTGWYATGFKNNNKASSSKTSETKTNNSEPSTTSEPSKATSSSTQGGST